MRILKSSYFDDFRCLADRCPDSCCKEWDVDIDEEKMMKAQKKNEAIILSMTRMERRNPDILNASRKRRIAAGSGTTVQEVNLLLKQFEQAKAMMKNMMGGMKNGRMKKMLGKKFPM